MQRNATVAPRLAGGVRAPPRSSILVSREPGGPALLPIRDSRPFHTVSESSQRPLRRGSRPIGERRILAAKRRMARTSVDCPGDADRCKALRSGARLIWHRVTYQGCRIHRQPRGQLSAGPKYRDAPDGTTQGRHGQPQRCCLAGPRSGRPEPHGMPPHPASRSQTSPLAGRPRAARWPPADGDFQRLDPTSRPGTDARQPVATAAGASAWFNPTCPRVTR